jgi:hypothetical protein
MVRVQDASDFDVDEHKFFFPQFYSFHFVCCIFIFCFSSLSCAQCMYLHWFWRSRFKKLKGCWCLCYCRSSSSITILSNHWSLSPHPSYWIELLFNYILRLSILTRPFQPTIIVKSPTLDGNFNSFHVVVEHIVTYDNSSNIMNGVKQEKPIWRWRSCSARALLGPEWTNTHQCTSWGCGSFWMNCL